MALQPHGAVPSERQLAWHRRPLYGFIHFTVNTFTDREWGYGDESPAIFAPHELDCDQWVAAAKAAGLEALILTAKHHDGFCLWPTKTTTHNVSASPFRDGKGDVVRELADACARGGIGLGLYCSPWDRNHPEYGRDEYVAVYHEQWKELLTEYGPLCELWLDGANGGDGYYGGAREKRSIDASTYYRFEELFAMMREHQPDAVIFSDRGPDVRWCRNESGFLGISSWAKVDSSRDAFGLAADTEQLTLGSRGGDSWRPVEVDVSIRPGWFFHPTERSRTGEELFTTWLNSVGRGAGLNLNLPPNHKGLIPTGDVLELMEMGERIRRFTAIDLAPDVEVTVEGGPEDAGALTDGRDDTFWAATADEPSVTFRLSAAERIRGVQIEEAIELGQRVGSFSIDVERWGGWHEWHRGATIGARAIVPLEGAIASSLRIRFTSTLAPPVLRRVRLFSAGQDLWAAQG
ncbi:MAG: alpha-L-fucosidase [Spirochaetales bacterium]